MAKWAVQGPDGKVIQFPDDFSDADVNREMGKMYAAPPIQAPPGSGAPSLKPTMPVPQDLQGPPDKPNALGFTKYPSATDALAADINALPQNFVGTAKELGRTVYGAGALAKNAVTGHATDDIQYPDELNPSNPEQAGGMRNTAIAEMFAPGFAASKVTKLLKAPAIVEGALNAAGTLALSKAQSGKTPGAGETALSMLPFAGAAAESAAPSLINRMIRPRGVELSFGKNPGQGIVDMGRKSLSSSLPDLEQNVKGAMNDVGQQIDKTVAPYSNTADVTGIVQKPVGDAMLRLGKRFPETHQAEIDALAKYDRDLIRQPLNQMTPSDVLDLKRHVADTVSPWNPMTAAFDDVVNKPKIAGFGGLKDKLNDMVPEVAPLNEQYANLTGAAKSLKRINSAAPPIAPWAEAAGMGAGLLGGEGGYSLTRGITGALGLRALAGLTRHPAFATPAAQFLDKAAPAAAEVGKNVGLGMMNTPNVPSYTLMTAPDGSTQHVPSDKVMEALGKKWQLAH